VAGQVIRQICVISGKGGTGKTSIVASFASLSNQAILADCDVDAANLDLVLAHKTIETHEFMGLSKAYISRDKCVKCDACSELCRWEAISDYTVDPLSCEGCGLCSHICPNDAISMKDVVAGHWYLSETPYGPLVHARLGVGQGNSGKLVTIIRKKAMDIAKETGIDLIIMDGPPGIGCPVIASITGVDLALIVTEPSVSGIHDMERVMAVCQSFSVPFMVCINRYDLNETMSAEIEDACKERGIAVAAKIPFDKNVTYAILDSTSIVEHKCNQVTTIITELWQRLLDRLI
jgi:MinD superfamily P-loop ATPase